MLVSRDANNTTNNNNTTNDDNEYTGTAGGGGGNLNNNRVQYHSISDIAQSVKQRYGSVDTGHLCDVCKKTKFATAGSNGNTCFSCKCRCCARCAFKYNTKTKVGSLARRLLLFLFSKLINNRYSTNSKYGRVCVVARSSRTRRLAASRRRRRRRRSPIGPTSPPTTY